MFFVVGHLDCAAAIGFVDRALHAVGHLVGIEDDQAVGVARGAAGRLRQRAVVAQEALLVGVQDSDKGYFRQVEAFAQQVHSYQHVEAAQSQVAQDLHPFHGIDFGVDVAHLDAQTGHILGQFFRHAFGQGGHQYAFVAPYPLLYFVEQVVDLVQAGPQIDGRIEETGGPDELFDDQAVGLLEFVFAGGGADVDHLIDQRLELGEVEGPVVERRRQPKTEVDEIELAGAVAAPHAPHLRNGHVAFIDDQQKIIGEVVEQTKGPGARLAAVEEAGIVLHAIAIAEFFHHFQVEGCPLLDPLGFQKTPFLLKVLDLAMQFILDLVHDLVYAFPRGHIQVGREDGGVLQGGDAMARFRLDLFDLLDLVAEEGHPITVLDIGQIDRYRIALHAEGGAPEIGFRARVQALHQLVEKVVARYYLPLFDANDAAFVVLRITHAVDARHRSHDDDVAPAAEQRRGGAQAQLVDLLVDGKVLFDVSVGHRDVGFRLVVVVIRHEILDRIIGKEILELAVQLRGQRLVVRQHQSGSVQAGNGVGNGEGLAGAGHAQQHLRTFTAFDSVDELLNGLWLIAGRLKRRNEFEGHSVGGLVHWLIGSLGDWFIGGLVHWGIGSLGTPGNRV